jgi:hypothetical protein
MKQTVVVQPNTTVGAVITRADGTVIDLGKVAASYRNPLRQAWWDHVGLRLANRRIHKANRGVRP